jgi:Kef-type K+ transport system membrane component KefB
VEGGGLDSWPNSFDARVHYSLRQGNVTSVSQSTASTSRDTAGPMRHLLSPRILLAIAPLLALIAVGMIHIINRLWQLEQLGHGGGFLVAKLLIVMSLIISVGNLGGWGAARCHQPRVVGEMIAGVALGPSLLGHFTPGIQHSLFPAELIPHLSTTAQMVLIIFIFLLGADLPLGLLRGSSGRIAVLEIGVLAIPFLCGILLALGLYKVYSPRGVTLMPFIFFIGVAMGVTAFPVLVRILADHDLTKSRIGILGLTMAGIGDAIAWCLLVIVVAAVHGDFIADALLAVALLILFAAVVWTVIRSALRQFLILAEKSKALHFSSAVVLLFSAISGAFITEWIGVHAIFGAFLVGMAVPRGNSVVQDLIHLIKRRLTIILPLFFALVGINVQTGFLANLRDFLVCGLITAVAIISKMGITTLLARLTKMTWRESAGLGVMMNCRGLTELVVLSTGLSLGIIGQKLFTMFIVMTLATTIMTGPLLRWLKLDKGSYSTRR